MPDGALQIQTGATPLDVVLDKKHYTGTTLASEIQTKVRALDAAYAAFTATFDDTTLRLSFSFTSNYTVIATDDRMAAVTGLVKNKITFSSGALIPDNQVELCPPCLYLVSSSLGYACVSGTQTAKVKSSFVIPVDQDVGSMISFNHASHFDQAISYGDGPKKLIHQIDMRIVDPHGHTLDPSIPFTVTLGYH